MQVARRGRPSTYTDSIADEICERLSAGEPLAQICRDEGMPHTSTVWRWGESDDAFAQRIARARDDGEDVIAANARRVARGEAPYSTGDVLRDRLVVDTDLKLLAKWNPRKYGDRIQHEHSGTITLAGVLAAVDEPLTIEGRADVSHVLPNPGSGNDGES